MSLTFRQALEAFATAVVNRNSEETLNAAMDDLDQAAAGLVAAAVAAAVPTASASPSGTAAITPAAAVEPAVLVPPADVPPATPTI